MSKINIEEAKILLECRYLVSHLKEIKEAISKMHEEPDESLLESYLQIFGNLEETKDSCIESAIKISEKVSWWNKKILHDLVQDISYYYSYVENDLNILQENIDKSQLNPKFS